jgi:hypothetical protein
MLVIDDHYDALRRLLWLETDRLYKSALEMLTRKKAFLQNRMSMDTLPDFTKGEAFKAAKPPISLVITGKDQARQLVRSIAPLLAGNGKLQKSTIIFLARRENAYFVNSDGASSVEPRQACWLTISAETQADDGMPLKNFLQYSAEGPGGIPGESRIKSDVAAMLRDLMALRNAPVAENYSGPVIFEQQAAAEILARGFIKALAAKRVSVSDLTESDMDTARMENALQSKAGSRVIGGAATVTAAPAMREYRGTPLLGSYAVDEEGVKAGDLVLVARGILKNLMTSRSPVKGFEASNGHCRGVSAMPGVIEISSEKAVSSRELKEKMLSLITDDNLKYGYLVKSILPPYLTAGDRFSRGQSSALPTDFQLTSPVRVYRVYPDGREELIRGAEFGRMGVRLFKDIAAIGDDTTVYNYPINNFRVPVDTVFPDQNGPMLGYYATVITPSLLFSEVDMNKPAGKYARPPVVPHP